ncbi:uncharacterized protein LOC110815171 isoform X2 [Carica papaya]|uniref:uncharacterized protein LOC110815171 isoform X2 n=1 Tax=Carica papaya TaxID=3649 RepID=UPI000B8D15F2|nr:uncharacterized protein LOC110815171 isoform X2 [Carica papaya]
MTIQETVETAKKEERNIINFFCRFCNEDNKIGEEKKKGREENKEEEEEIERERFKGMRLQKYETGGRRQEQKKIRLRIEKELKARYQLEELIQEQLNRYRTTIPMPPHELAAISWNGDWRPSLIIHLLQLLIPHSSNHRLLPQLLHDVRIEEAIIDGQMAELQAHPPFFSNSSAMNHHFNKIHNLISKAQQLRFNTLEMAVNKVLNLTDAAKFLVAFSGIQDAIHHFAHQQRIKGLPTLPASRTAWDLPHT